jgi:hypothetical protein
VVPREYPVEEAFQLGHVLNKGVPHLFATCHCLQNVAIYPVKNVAMQINLDLLLI